MSAQTRFAVAVAIACYNEAATIASVVREFRAALPDAAIYVFDNNSNDGAAQLADEAGALVRSVRRQGKGHVTRAILDTVVADATVIVDGDGTYPARHVFALLDPIREGVADMVVGDRLDHPSRESLRQLHRLGNRTIVATINLMFGTRYRDILSGYRVLSRRFVETVPVLTAGFEIETELTVRALEEGMTILEIPIDYLPRPVGSASKLRTFHDGYRIVLTAAVLLRDHYPLRVFGLFGIFLLMVATVVLVLRALVALGASTLPGAPLEFIALLAAPLGMLSLGVGFTVNAVNTRFREMAQISRRVSRGG